MGESTSLLTSKLLKIAKQWGALAFLLMVAACAPTAAQSPAQNRIVYGLTLLPSGFDPHIHASSELGIPLRQVYDTLVYRDPTTNEFVPGLATEWTVSEDGLIYTFTLRQGVKFHDGTSFNAQSVVSNMERIISPDTGSQRARFMLGPYLAADIVDEYTIRLTLSEPYSPLLDSLSQVYLGMASPAAFSAVSNNRYQFHQVGTGPFTFVEYVPGDRIVLRRNPEYWGGPRFYTAPTPQSVDEIEYRFFTDEATRALALESGEAQIMGEIPPVEARAVTGNSAIQLLPVPIPGQPLQFLMNTQRYPTDNLAVRQALLYAANRNAIVDTVYQRFSPVAWGPLSANNPFYSRAMAGSYATDTARAQALLQAAGYVDTNNDGYLDFSGVELTVDVLVPPWGLVPEVAQLLQDQWRTVGVRANLNAVPTYGALIEAVESGEYNLVAFYTFGVDASLLNEFFVTDGSTNWSNVSIPELDAALNEATRTNDLATRRALYETAQNIIMSNALILPIRDYVNLNAADRRLQGLTFDAYGWFPVMNNASLGA